MKIIIVSDIHANLAALKALPEEQYDQLWCLGDLVDYGPRPHETIQWVKSHARVVVRGNHDHAAGFAIAPQCSLPYKHLAVTTRQYTQEVCTKNDFEFLRELPLTKVISVLRTKFYLVHAAPTDPLFGYLPEDSEQWVKEVQTINADVLLVGHTHTPFTRKVGNCTVVNPGSVGQPKTGRPLACYAVWEDGQIYLKEYEYPVTETVREIQKMPLPKRDLESLISVLRTGQLPTPPERVRDAT
jgi:protein phosphatase